MPERILAAYDGSPLAREALTFALERFADADVTAVYVIQIPEADLPALVGPEMRLPTTDRAEAYAEEVLDGARRIADDHDRSIQTAVDSGRPDRRIVDRAASGTYDAIAIGCHGRAGPAEAFVGGVTERVVRRSPIPVLVVR